MSQLSIMDSFRVKRQVLVSAAEAAEMVLRCDEVNRPWFIFLPC